MEFRISQDEVLVGLYKAKEDTGKCAIILPGLPEQPRNLIYGEELANNNINVFQPRYIGSWESSGDFSLANCLDTLRKTLKLVKEESATESYACKEITWKCKEIIVLATSFGGAIQLSLKDMNDINKLISIAPLINLNKHNRNPEIKEQDLSFLYDFLKRGFKEAYRGFKKSDWNNFLEGKSIVNPMNNYQNIKEKKILLIHGEKDETVSILRTKEFYNLIKENNDVVLKIYDNCVHGKSIKKASLQYVIDWILKK